METALVVFLVLLIVILSVQPDPAGKVIAVAILVADIMWFSGAVFTVIIVLALACLALRVGLIVSFGKVL